MAMENRTFNLDIKQLFNSFGSVPHTNGRHHVLATTSGLVDSDTCPVGKVDCCSKEQSTKEMSWTDLVKPISGVALSVSNTDNSAKYSDGENMKRSLLSRRPWKPIVPRYFGARTPPTERSRPIFNYNHEVVTYSTAVSVSSTEHSRPIYNHEVVTYSTAGSVSSTEYSRPIYNHEVVTYSTAGSVSSTEYSRPIYNHEVVTYSTAGSVSSTEYSRPIYNHEVVTYSTAGSVPPTEHSMPIYNHEVVTYSTAGSVPPTEHSRPIFNYNHKVVTYSTAGSVSSYEAKPRCADFSSTRRESQKAETNVFGRDGAQCPDIPSIECQTSRRGRKRQRGRGGRPKKIKTSTELKQELFKECYFLFDSWENTRDVWLQSSSNSYFGKHVRSAQNIQIVERNVAFGQSADDTGMFFGHSRFCLFINYNVHTYVYPCILTHHYVVQMPMQIHLSYTVYLYVYVLILT